jgi:hypothetical protein
MTFEDPDGLILDELLIREKQLISSNIKKILSSFGHVAEYYQMKGRLDSINRVISLIFIARKWNTQLNPHKLLRLHAIYAAIDNLRIKYKNQKLTPSYTDDEIRMYRLGATNAIKDVLNMLDSDRFYKSEVTWAPQYFDPNEIMEKIKQEDSSITGSQL